MSDQLKPCPFCGDVDTLNRGDFIECSNCLAESPFMPDGDVIEAWNTRAATPDEVRYREALEEIAKFDPYEPAGPAAATAQHALDGKDTP